MSDKHSGRAALAAGCLFSALLVFCAFGAPYISPYSPAEMDLCIGLQSPSYSHPFGLDKHGRDILSRMIYGARVSVMVGFGTVFISAFIGFVVGAFSGLKGGIWDQIIMRFVDVLLAFPGILLAIALTAVTGPSILNVIIALSARGWVSYARIVRGQVLVEREKGYVEAARAIGGGTYRIIFRHLLPNTVTPVIIQATFGMAGAILAESSLSFLGAGASKYSNLGRDVK